MNQTVRKAVFPVAGLGTRFLPANKAMPKELLPIVDRPLIQYAVDEARVAGIEEFIFVLAFVIFVVIRMFNPDLWHPYRGGEKPIELAHIKALTRSLYLPPYDPW